MRWSLCGGLWIVAILSGPAFAEVLPPVNKPSPKLGRAIEYDSQVAGCKRWQVTDADKDGSTISRCGDGMTAYAANGNLTKIVSESGITLLEFKPQFFTLSFPLKVGKKWDGKYTGYSVYSQIDSTGVNWSGNISCEVKSPEIVMVPAGQFDAYRIDCIDMLTAGPSSGRMHLSLWYAPKVGETVKAVNAEHPEWNYQVTSITDLTE